VFLFQAGTTLITAANTRFILTNGAKAENVLWALGTAATLGPNSVLEGSILAGTAITIGHNSKLNGCALAQTAVTFVSQGRIDKPITSGAEDTEDTDSIMCASGSLSQSVCQGFAVHARAAVNFNGFTTIQGGDVGIFPGTSVTGSYLIGNGAAVNYQSEAFADSVTADLAAAIVPRTDGKTMKNEMGGKTFTPGTYRSESAINFAFGTVVTLDGLNQTDPVFLFQAGTTLVTAANTHFILKNGARAENVLWALGTGATLGANSVLEGSILAGSAITLGTKAKLNGCALAQTAVSFNGPGFHEQEGKPAFNTLRHLRG